MIGKAQCITPFNAFDDGINFPVDFGADEHRCEHLVRWNASPYHCRPGESPSVVHFACEERRACQERYSIGRRWTRNRVTRSSAHTSKGFSGWGTERVTEVGVEDRKQGVGDLDEVMERELIVVELVLLDQ